VGLCRGSHSTCGDTLCVQIMSHDRLLACRAAPHIVIRALVHNDSDVCVCDEVMQMCRVCSHMIFVVKAIGDKAMWQHSVTVPVCVWTPCKLVTALSIVDSLMHGGDNGAIGSLKACTACKQLLSHNDGVGTLV